MIKELAQRNRSYRRFYQEKKIDRTLLTELVDIGRLTPSAANRQPIRYRLICEPQENEKVYTCLGWAGYYKDWAGPDEGERPSGYIIMMTPEGVCAEWDEGIAGQTMLLAAVEKGLGGCFIGNIQREKLAAVLNLPQGYKIDLCLALGYPKEQVVLEEISGEDDYRYYRDENSTQHVPKKRLTDILI